MRRKLADWLYMLAARIAPPEPRHYHSSHADINANALAWSNEDAVDAMKRFAATPIRGVDDENWPDEIDAA